MLCLHGASARALGLIMGGLSLIAVAGIGLAAETQDMPTFEITLKDQTFTPDDITVPADRPFVIKLTNEKDALAEFESREMRFEKVAAGRSTILTRVKTLEARLRRAPQREECWWTTPATRRCRD